MSKISRRNFLKGGVALAVAVGFPLIHSVTDQNNWEVVSQEWWKRVEYGFGTYQVAFLLKNKTDGKMYEFSNLIEVDDPPNKALMDQEWAKAKEILDKRSQL